MEHSFSCSPVLGLYLLWRGIGFLVVIVAGVYASWYVYTYVGLLKAKFGWAEVGLGVDFICIFAGFGFTFANVAESVSYRLWECLWRSLYAWEREGLGDILRVVGLEGFGARMGGETSS